MLQQALVQQHYLVELATDGLTAWNLVETETYDLILLDWVLPKLTGIEFCQQLRKHSVLNPNRDTPVLLMTALDTVTNKVMGLNAGADDYVVKPFELDELLARIRALLRRSQNVRSPLLQWGEICLNPSNCLVTYQGQPIGLAAKEYELLELFLRNPNQMFSRNRLLTALWNVEEMPGEATIRAHIKSLRQKLKQAGAEDPIETIYKLGYRLKQQQIPGQGDRVKGVETDQSSPSSPSSPVPPELWEAWQEARQSYRARLSLVQQAVIALQNQMLTPGQQKVAEREAHTLVGSLGSFGLEEASRISRQIQQIFQQLEPPEPPDVEKLLLLIGALWQQLGNSEDEKTAAINRLEPPCNASSPAGFVPLLLIVDDDLPWVQELATEALSCGWQAKIATTLKEAQQFLQDGAVDAMLLNLDFSDSGGSGLEFLATVRLQYPKLPVITLTAAPSFEQRIAAARWGTRCFLKKPIPSAEVLTAVAPVLQLSNPSPTRILIVDDDAASLQLLNSLLASEGYQVTLLNKPEQFWQTLEQTAPDLLILEVELYHPSSSQSNPGQVTPPPCNGIELCQVIRSDPGWNRLPVVFLSAQTNSETVQRCFTVGADDFLSKPVVAQELLTRVRTRLEQRKRWGLLSDRASGT